MGSHKISLSLFFFHSLSALIMPCRAKNLAQDYVNAHNTPRGQVGVGGVTWNMTLADYNQNYANQRISYCAALTDSNGPTLGENLAKVVVSPLAAVNLWVAEKQYHNYTTNSCTEGKQCFHYTQVVWCDSVRICYARVQCTNGWYYVICSYDPPGNWIGNWPN